MGLSTPILAMASLGPLEQLGRGGQAVVFRAPGASVPGVRGRLVFKRYHEDWLDGRRTAVAHSVGRLIAVRDTTPIGRLDTHSTWPVAVVSEDGGPESALGVLIRELPTTCYVDTVVFTGTRRSLWEISKQLQAPDDLARRGLPVLDPVQRLTLLARLAQFAAFLHRSGVIMGDLSGRNVVLRRDPAGGIHPMLVDTDGYRLVGQGSHFPQGNTPDWEAPESLRASERLDRLKAAGGSDSSEAVRLAAQANVQNQRSDVYKVALLALRLFHEGRDHTLIRTSATAGAALQGLVGARRSAVVDAGLDGDPARRPTMAELARALSGVPS